jgi:hypothetical protein
VIATRTVDLRWPEPDGRPERQGTSRRRHHSALRHDQDRRGAPVGDPAIEQTEGRRMSTEENKALVRRFYEEIDKGNVDALDELVAEDYIDHNPPRFPCHPAERA